MRKADASDDVSRSRPDKESLELYDAFLARTGVDRLQKLLARYELFQLAMNVPGDVVECGVFKGSGIYTWAKLRRLFKPNNEQWIVGFDFFEAGRDVELGHKEDRQVLEEHASGWATREEILANLQKGGLSHVELIPGNVIDTTKAYAESRVGFRIALLYLDLDNYEGTLASLKHLFPLVSPGGVVAFDEYGQRGYGESDAVDEYFRGRHVVLRSFAWANTPTAYVIKEADAWA